MWEIRYVNWKSKEIVTVRQVPSFALASTVAKELPNAIGWQVTVTRITDTSHRFEVWVWVIKSQKWIRIKGKPITKQSTMRFHARWDFETSVPIYWPVGVPLPPSVPHKAGQVD